MCSRNMLSFDDDDVYEYGPQHSTPIKASQLVNNISDEQWRGEHPHKVTGGSRDRNHEDTFENMPTARTAKLVHSEAGLSDSTVDISKISLIESTPKTRPGQHPPLKCICHLSSQHTSASTTLQADDTTVHTSPHLRNNETSPYFYTEQPPKLRKYERSFSLPSACEFTPNAPAVPSISCKQNPVSSFLSKQDTGSNRTFSSECTSDSDQPQGRQSPKMGLRHMGSVAGPLAANRISSPRKEEAKTHHKVRASSAPRCHHDLNTCNHSNDSQFASYSFTEFRKVPAAYIEQDIINKQRHEIQLLMEELGTRDQELNDLVLSHQKQVKAWESDCEKLSMLQERVSQYEEELKNREEQLRETLDEMSKVNEQRDVDARELERTKDEMMKLAERIMENSLYIQEMEAQNQKLTASLKELCNVRKAFSDREQELMVLVEEKDYQMSDKQQEIDKLVEHIKFLECRCEELEDKNANLAAESSAWKKKYCLAKDETDRLTNECSAKEENLHKMTQQLHESLQQAIALQKALFTSCEREKCKEEVMYSLRKQHKRTMQELQNIRELYDRQNRDTTLYHLSVKDKDINNGKKWEDDIFDEGKKKKEESRQQKREDEKGKQDGKLKHDRNMSFHVLKSATLSETADSSVRFLVKEKKEKKRIEKGEEKVQENLGGGDGGSGCTSQDKESKSEYSGPKPHTPKTSPKSSRNVRNEQLSPIAVKASHTPMFRNATTITSSTSLLTEDMSIARVRSQCQSKTSLMKQQHPLDTVQVQAPPPDLESNIAQVVEEQIGKAQPDCLSSSTQRKTTRSRTTSPIVTREGPSTRTQKRGNPCSSSPNVKRNKAKDRGMPCESSSDISHIASPAKFDDELTPADSDGMCHELKRDISRIGTEASDTLCSIQEVAGAPFKFSAQPLPNPKKSSFLKKEKIEKKITFSANENLSPKYRNRRKGTDGDTRKEPRSSSQSHDGGQSDTHSPTSKHFTHRERKDSVAEKESPTGPGKWKSHNSMENPSPEREHKSAKSHKENQSPQSKKMSRLSERNSPQSKQKDEWKPGTDQAGFGYFMIGQALKDSGTELSSSKQEAEAAAAAFPQQSQATQSKLSFNDIEKILEYNSTLSNPNKHSLQVASGHVAAGENHQPWTQHFDIDPFLVHSVAVKDALTQPSIRKLQLQAPGIDHFLGHWGGVPTARATMENLPEDVSVYLARQWPLRTSLYFNNNKSMESHSESDGERKDQEVLEVTCEKPVESCFDSVYRESALPSGDQIMQQGDKKSVEKCHTQKHLHEGLKGKGLKDPLSSDGQRRYEDRRKYTSKYSVHRENESREKRYKDYGSVNNKSDNYSEVKDPFLSRSSDKKDNWATMKTDSAQSAGDETNIAHLPGKLGKSRPDQKDVSNLYRSGRDEEVSESSSEGMGKKRQTYFYTEDGDSRSTNASGKGDAQMNGQQTVDAPVIAPVSSKPFTSARGPSLYKHLSQIHFSEKTRRYEWVSQPVFAVTDKEQRRQGTDKSSNCLPSQHDKSDEQFSDSEQIAGGKSQDKHHGVSKSDQHKEANLSHTQHSDSGHFSVSENHGVHSRHDRRSPVHTHGQQDKNHVGRYASSHRANARDKVDGCHCHSQKSRDQSCDRLVKCSADPEYYKPKNNNNNSGASAGSYHGQDASAAEQKFQSHLQQNKNSNNNNGFIHPPRNQVIRNINMDESCLGNSVTLIPERDLDSIVKRLNFDDSNFQESGEEMEPVHHQDVQNLSSGNEVLELETRKCTEMENSECSQMISGGEQTEKNVSNIKMNDKVRDCLHGTNIVKLDVECEDPANVRAIATQSATAETCQSHGLDEQDLQPLLSKVSPRHCNTVDNNCEHFGTLKYEQYGHNFSNTNQLSEKLESVSGPCLSQAKYKQCQTGESVNKVDVSKCQSDHRTNADITGQNQNVCGHEDKFVSEVNATDDSGCERGDSGEHHVPDSQDDLGLNSNLPEYFKDISTLLVDPEEESELLEIRGCSNDEKQSSDGETVREIPKDATCAIRLDDEVPHKLTEIDKREAIADQLCNDLLAGHLTSGYWMKNTNYNKNIPVLQEDQSISVTDCVETGAIASCWRPVEDHPNCEPRSPHLNIATQQQFENSLENTRDSNTSTLSKNSDSARFPGQVHESWLEEATDQFSERLQSFLEEPEAESSLQVVSMSPVTKLHRLLVESQLMIRSLEKTSAVPDGIKSKVLMSSAQ